MKIIHYEKNTEVKIIIIIGGVREKNVNFSVSSNYYLRFVRPNINLISDLQLSKM